MPLPSLRRAWLSDDPAFFMILCAFVLRVAFIFIFHTYRFAEAPHHFGFGFETGSIAGAIARGEGFSSPFGVPHTGPTAWLAPAYPYFVAGVFKIFGLFSTPSAIVILIFNSICAALTCYPIFRISERLFGRLSALLAGWMWASVPFFFRWAITWVWETALSALLIATGTWLALSYERLSWRRWILFGLFSGISALVNPSLVVIFPLLALWSVWKRRDQTGLAFRQLLLFLALTVVVISPWLVRNRLVFGKWVFLRSNAGFEFCLGNFGSAPGVPFSFGHPTGNPGMLDQYRYMGEIHFVEWKQAQALQWVKTHRGDFYRTTMQRTLDFWDGGELKYEHNPPWRPWMVIVTSAPALLGLIFATTRRFRDLAPIWIVVLLYPAPYYITLTTPRFRHPIEPVLVVLMAYFIVLMSEELLLLFRKLSRKTGVMDQRTLPSRNNYALAASSAAPELLAAPSFSS